MGVGSPGLILRERAPTVEVTEIVAATSARLTILDYVPEMALAS